MDIIKKYIYGKKITRKNKNKKSTSKKTKKRKNILKVNKLSNGLHYNISNIPEYNKVCICLSIKTGSNSESNNLFGMAHFLEHMLFKGTYKFSNQSSLTKKVEDKQGKINGYTTNIITQYYISIPSKNAHVALKTIIKMLMNSILMCRDIELEKRVVNNEKNKRNDNINTFLFKSAVSFHFGENTPYGHFVNGKKSKVDSFTRGHLLAFLNYYYIPENIHIGVFGKINKELKTKLENIIIKKLNKKQILENYQPLKFSNEEKIFYKITEELTDYNQKNKNYKPQTNKKKLNIIINKNLNHSFVSINFTTNGLFSDNNIYDNFMIKILSSGMNSLFFKEIREKNGFVYNIKCNKLNYDNIGLFQISFSTFHNRVNIVIDYIFDILVKLKKNGVSEKEINNYRKKKEKQNKNTKTIDDILDLSEFILFSNNKEKYLNKHNTHYYNYSKLNKKYCDLYIKKLFNNQNMTCTICTIKNQKIKFKKL